MKAVADAGHEIGIHGCSHENPIAMTREQEMAVLDKCIELVTRLSGRRPTGYVAPWWEFSTVTNELLLERGIKYDHSLMHHDHRPYYVRVGDSWTKIDYSKQPREWMVPLWRGRETDLIEIPANWYLDDLPPMLFINKSPNSHGFVNPRDIEQMWRDQFDWVYREYDYAVFPITIHPDVSGRPHVLMMLERLYHHMIGHPGVRFVTMNEMADDFARRSPRRGKPHTATDNGKRPMCALCGVLGGTQHWTDAVAQPGVFTRNTDVAARRRERMKRVAAANRVLAYYRMKLADWQGSALVLSTPTGKAEIVDNLAHLWMAAERLVGRPCDPLDEGLIAFMEREAG